MDIYSMPATGQRSTDLMIGAKHLVPGFCLSILFAYAMYSFVAQQGLAEVSKSASADASQIVAVTGGFVRTYSVYNSMLAPDTLPSPAAFRADALRHVEQEQRAGNTLATGVLGLPGREIAEVAKDDVTRNHLLTLEAQRSRDMIDTITKQGEKQIHQSLWAFYATEQSCADCHNRLQNLVGDKKWKVGDLMGAQFVQRDITSLLKNVERHAMVQACLLFVALLVGWVLCLYLVNHFRLTRQFKRLASTDPLTGCMNRREFQDRISQLEGSTDGALLMLDLDKFKSINDNHGHDAGDKIIKDFSQRLEAHIRERDWVVRFGGEEFVIWLPDIKPVNAIQVAERLKENVELAEVAIGDSSIKYTVSIGLAIVEKSLPSQFESWIKVADELLYRAKDGGRNRIICGSC